MPIRYFHAGVLFGIAVDSARNIQAQPRKGGQKAALVSIVFSVVALEAFMNEITGAAQDALAVASYLNPPELSVFAHVMADAEDARSRLESKFTLAKWTLAGKNLERGAPPYQDFALLVRLRNDLVHFKANDAFDQGTSAEEIHKDLLRRFGAKHILAEDIEYSAGMWTYLIETKAVAEWSCRTAANMVRELCASAVQSSISPVCENVQKSFEAQCAML